MSDVCPTCNNEFKGIGSHWQQSDCPYPELTLHQKQVITGILMGDGTINRQSGVKPRFRVDNTNKEYLEYVNKILKPYSNGVNLVKESHDVADHFQSSGFTEGVSEEDCSDLYAVWTTTSEVFKDFANWYSESGKVFPEEIEISSTTLKHWFVCDGYANKRGSSYYIGIQMANEANNKQKIEKYFSDGPGVTISRWNDRTGGERRYCCAEFTYKQSMDLIEYMGDPITGFEYKWPDDY